MNGAAWRRLGSVSPGVVTLASAVGLTAFVCWLKLCSLYSWRYTSDLFTYDQVLAETLAGHFGVEYTFGNIFGDHAYLFLLTLLPAKALLGEKMVVALLVLPPIAYLLTAIGGYATIRRTTGDVHLSLLCAWLLLLPYGVVEGLYHARHGAHPMDELAGFLVVGVALLLRRADTAEAFERRTRFAFVAALLAFVSLKEEYATLGLLFAAVLLAFERSRRNFSILLVTISALALEVGVMEASATPFNDRTMAGGVADFLSRLGSRNPWELVAELPFEYVAVLLSLTLAFVAAVRALRVFDRYAVALFVVGGAKIGLSLVVRDDVDLGSWHNYPGVFMLTGAVVLQLSAPSAARLRSLRLGWLYVSASVVAFLGTQLDLAVRYERMNSKGARLAAKYRPDLHEVIRKVEPDAVVAITPFTAAEWTLNGHHRYTFYPRGVDWSPIGIADYVVLESKQVQIRSFWTPPRSRRQVAEDHPEFRVIFRNGHFYLLKRYTWTAESRRARREWVDRFGAGSLGSGALWSVEERRRAR